MTNPASSVIADPTITGKGRALPVFASAAGAEVGVGVAVGVGAGGGKACSKAVAMWLAMKDTPASLGCKEPGTAASPLSVERVMPAMYWSASGAHAPQTDGNVLNEVTR